MSNPARMTRPFESIVQTLRIVAIFRLDDRAGVGGESTPECTPPFEDVFEAIDQVRAEVDTPSLLEIECPSERTRFELRMSQEVSLGVPRSIDGEFEIYISCLRGHLPRRRLGGSVGAMERDGRFAGRLVVGGLSRGISRNLDGSRFFERWSRVGLEMSAKPLRHLVANILVQALDLVVFSLEVDFE